MKILWSNFVSNVLRNFLNIGHNSILCSWKLSKSGSECLNHISQIKSPNDTYNFFYMKKIQLNAYKRYFDNEYLISIHDINSY